MNNTSRNVPLSHAHLLENFALRKGHGACYGSNKENNGHCQIKCVKLDINSNEYDVIVHMSLPLKLCKLHSTPLMAGDTLQRAFSVLCSYLNSTRTDILLTYYKHSLKSNPSTN